MWSKFDLERLGFKFTHVITFRYVEIVFPTWRGQYHNDLRIQLQNRDEQFVVNRACRYGWGSGVDHLAHFPFKGTGYKKVRKVFNDGRKVINRYERTDPKYADMIASAIVHARNMMRKPFPKKP